MNYSLMLSIWSGIWNGICKFLYSIVKAIADLCSWCELLFRKFAGLDTYYMNGEKIEGDILQSILQTDIVKNLLISLLVLGIILLLIVTFVAVWKTEWDFGKEGNNKSKIIKAAFRALFNFIAVPVICLFGIFVGNALLKAIDSATSISGNGTFSSLITSSMQSSSVRADYMDSDYNYRLIMANTGAKIIDKDGKILSGKTEPDLEAGEEKVYGIYSLFTSTNGDIDKAMITRYFENKEKVKNTQIRIFEADGTLNNSSLLNYKLKNGEFVFDNQNDDIIEYFYDYTKMNFVATIIILIIITKAMLNMAFMLIQRLFSLTILFVISPPIVAMTPLNAKALDGWKGLFIKNATMGYLTIAVYNLFMSIYQVFKNITLFPDTGVLIIPNYFVNLLIICAGLMTIDSLSSTLADKLGLGIGGLTPSKENNWGKAFGMMGGTSWVTTPVKAVGKAVEYGNVARYKGLGQAAKQLGADTWSTAQKKIKPLGQAVKLKDEAIAPFKANKKFRSEAGISDVKKQVNVTKQDLKAQANAALNNLGEKQVGVGLRANKIANSINNDQDYKAYREQMKTLNELSSINPEEMTSEQTKALKDANDYITKLSNETTTINGKQMSMLDKYNNYDSFNEARDKYDKVNGQKTFTNLVRENDGGKLNDKRKADVTSAKDVIADNQAKRDAIGKATYDKVDAARKKADEQLERIKEIETKQQKVAQSQKETADAIKKVNKNLENLDQQVRKSNEKKDK